MNVAPRPGPALRASRRPPCSSTSCFEIDRPSPSPPCRACRWRRPGGSGRTRGAGSRRRSLAGVGHRDPQHVRPALDADRHPPALGRELHRVVDQVPQHLLDSLRVGVRTLPASARRAAAGASCRDALGLGHRPHRVDRRRDDRARPPALAHVERSLPETMRDTSSRSSTSCWLPSARLLDRLDRLRLLVARPRRAAGGPRAGSPSAARSSWLTTATNSSFIVIARSASHRAPSRGRAAAAALLLDLPPLGQVAADLGEPARALRPVAQRGRHAAGPEPRAVLRICQRSSSARPSVRAVVNSF